MDLTNLLTPITRTGGYYARSWRRYLAHQHSGDLPLARPTLALAGQALRDEIVLAHRFEFGVIDPGEELVERGADHHRHIGRKIGQIGAIG